MKKEISEIYFKLKMTTNEVVAVALIASFFILLIYMFFWSVYVGSQIQDYPQFTGDGTTNLIITITLLPVICAYGLIYRFGGQNPSRRSFYLLIAFLILFFGGFTVGAITGLYPFFITKILVLPVIVGVFFVIQFLLKKAVKSI